MLRTIFKKLEGGHYFFSFNFSGDVFVSDFLALTFFVSGSSLVLKGLNPRYKSRDQILPAILQQTTEANL